MEICKKKIVKNTILISFFLCILIKPGNTDLSFKNFESKKVSYIDFFMLKFENKLAKRSLYLRRQLMALRVQYSSVGVEVDFNKKKENIKIIIYTIMDKQRYSKKKYSPKLSDCNQVRNLIFYNKYGYKFFTQKRDPALSEDVMKDIFKTVFFKNISFTEEEKFFLMDKMYVEVTIYHPIKKTETSCAGRVNDFELK